MKVILLKNVENLGNQGEVKEVSRGYARNFLIPQGLAKPATEKAIEEAREQLAGAEIKAKAELEQTEQLVAKLDGYEVKIPVKVGEEGQLFAQVSKGQIASVLEAAGFGVADKQIRISNPIKETGEFLVVVEFDHGLEAQIRVIVEAEEK